MIKIDFDLCDLCGSCVAVCPEDCIELFETYLQIDNDKCSKCLSCVKICPVGALTNKNSETAK